MDPKLIRCQECGEPLGYVTMSAEGPAQLRQLLRDARLVAICLECAQNKGLPWKTG